MKNIIIALAVFGAVCAAAATIATATAEKRTIRKWCIYFACALLVVVSLVIPFISGALFALLKYARGYK